jgi:hypothetical protein
VSGEGRVQSRNESRTVLVENVLPVWQRVRTIREKVGEVLAGYSDEVRSAAMITASELLENAVKYAEQRTPLDSVTLELALNESSVRIKVSNAASAEAALELDRRINEIEHSADKEALYLARLETLLSTPSELGKLGLYRIAFEGGFGLASERVNGVVTVTATRSL